jgi:ferredoxin
VCPTCHCFDIVDEAEGVTSGTRRRNWDTCQASRFTVHASGHNPRPDQSARFRQRLTHKFHIYLTRFGEVLCTGCGRCSKACPGGMDLPEVLQAITRLAEGPGQASGGEA